MAIDVGTLQVNLTANTASFSGPLSKAEQQAKNSSRNIQESFNKMDLSEARGSIMVLGEEIGVHLPRHVQALIAELPGLGAALSAAFPLLAIVAVGMAIVEVAEKIRKFHEEAEKAADDQTKLGTAINTTFNSLDDKLLQAGIHSDELNDKHLSALKKQLELIDHQSMQELAHSFDIISKAADVVFQDLKSHWYTFGIGSDGAKHALTEFQTQYDSLLAQGKDKEASDLLAGTLASAEKILHFQKEYIGNQTNADTGKGGDGRENPDYYKFEEASLELKKAGVGVTDNEVKSQQALVDTLRAQVGVQEKVAALNKAQKDNAKKDTGIKIGGDKQKQNEQELQQDLARINSLKEAAIQAYTQMGLSYDDARAKADAQFSGAELDAHIAFFDKQEAAAVKTAEKQKINAERNIFLDQQMAKASDQLAQTQAKNTKAIDELAKQSAADSKAMNDQFQKQQMAQVSEKVKAMIQRINLIRAETDAEADQAALEQVHAIQRVRDIQTEINALNRLRNTAKENGQSTLAIDAAIHEAEMRKMQDYQRELLATNKLGDTFKAFAIQMQMEAKQTGEKVFQVLNQTFQGLNQNLAQFLVEGQANWRQLAATAIESIIQIGLQYIETKIAMMIIDKLTGGSAEDKNREQIRSNAALAKSDAYTAADNTLAQAPWPTNLIAAPIVLGVGLGFASLAGKSASRGGILPNAEALVHTHPEEMILPRHISNFIVNAASSSSGTGHGPVVFAPKVSAFDAEGIDRVLEKRMDVFMKKFEREMRRRHLN